MTETQSDVRKRIIFLMFFLGVMAGIGVYLVYKATQQQNFALIAVVLPMALASIPMVKSLRQLIERRRNAE